MKTRKDAAPGRCEGDAQIGAQSSSAANDERDCPAILPSGLREACRKLLGVGIRRRERDIAAQDPGGDECPARSGNLDRRLEDSKVPIESGRPYSVHEAANVPLRRRELQRGLHEERPQARKFHAHQVAAQGQDASLHRPQAARCEIRPRNVACRVGSLQL